MNKRTKWVVAGLAAAAWAAAARGELYTTWELPENSRVLEEAYEASTNVTEVLGVGRTLDRNGVVVLYRKRAIAESETASALGEQGDAFAAMVVNETKFLSALRLTRAAGGGSGAVVEMAARDDSGNYATGSRLEEIESLGSGWREPWNVSENVTTVKLPEDPSGWNGFRVDNASGDYGGLTREFETAAQSGELGVSAFGVGAGDSGFWGFSVYGYRNGSDTLTELLRWGVVKEGEGGLEGLAYSTLEGLTAYALVERELGPIGLPPSDVDYSLTWTRDENDGMMHFSLSAYYDINHPELVFFEGVPLASLAGVAAVKGFGVTLSGGNSMVWDYVEASGYGTVPEPGTAGLLLAGMAVLAGWRRRRAKKA